MKIKGKDPTAVFWKAYGLGMTGNYGEARRQLESFQSRRDMQLPVTMALLYFARKAPNLDRELIESLDSELTVAEDVTVRAYKLQNPTAHNYIHLVANKTLHALTQRCKHY